MACGVFALVLTALPAFQQGVGPVPITDPPHDAGTYHLATGTWTRPGTKGQEGAGLVVYNNDAFNGYYNPTSSDWWIDTGRVPSTSSTAVVGTQDSYQIDAFTLAYCIEAIGPYGPIDAEVSFWSSLAACTSPSGPPDAILDLDGLPGLTLTGAYPVCWIVTIDLTGAGEFCLPADGDGHFDDTPSLDTFGWSLRFDALGPGQIAGPLFAGIPGVYPFGDGTSFQNPGATGTGLGTTDEVWFEPHGGIGTCVSLPGFHSSHFLMLAADPYGECSPLGTSYCVATPNSTGAPALVAPLGSNRIHLDDLTLRAEPVPPSQFGLFFYGPDMAQTPFGNGFLCVAPGATGFGRLPVEEVSASGVLEHAVDYSAPPTPTTVITPGSTWNFQAWFRDPAAGTAFFDLSDATAITFVP